MVIKGISSIHRQYEIIFAAESQIANAEWQLPRHSRHWCTQARCAKHDIQLHLAALLIAYLNAPKWRLFPANQNFWSTGNLPPSRVKYTAA
jgi:hypothetical protein